MLNIVVQFFLSIDTIIIPVGLVISAIFALIAMNEKEAVRKNKLNHIALWAGVGPILIMIIVLSLWSLVQIISHLK